MKLIKPDAEIIEQSEGIQGVYEAIAQAAATCYKSEAKAGEYAKTFVDKLIANKHYAMLEFGTIYLDVPESDDFVKYHENPYSHMHLTNHLTFAVTTNYRVIIENGWEEDLKYMCEPTQYHIKRYTAKFITSIGVGREFTRHRVFSFAQESTRYCNYSKNKFGNELTFIIPSWTNLKEEGYYGPLGIDMPSYITGPKDFGFNAFTPDLTAEQHFVLSCVDAQWFYLDLIKEGLTAQQAREVLPLCTKSELCMCGFEGDWKHFFDLRLRGTTGKPHPDAQYCAELLHNKFKEKGIEL